MNKCTFECICGLDGDVTNTRSCYNQRLGQHIHTHGSWLHLIIFSTYDAKKLMLNQTYCQTTTK